MKTREQWFVSPLCACVIKMLHVERCTNSTKASLLTVARVSLQFIWVQTLIFFHPFAAGAGHHVPCACAWVA